MRTHADRKSHKTARPSAAAVEYFSRKLEFEIGPHELRELLDWKADGIRLLDVRDESKFDEGHIPGARSVPVEAIPTVAERLPRDKTIVTYCGDITCPLSSIAALELAERGFRVRHLVGGVTEWVRKGFGLQPTGENSEGPME